MAPFFFSAVFFLFLVAAFLFFEQPRATSGSLGAEHQVCLASIYPVITVFYRVITRFLTICSDTTVIGPPDANITLNYCYRRLPSGLTACTKAASEKPARSGNHKSQPARRGRRCGDGAETGRDEEIVSSKDKQEKEGHARVRLRRTTG